MDSPSAPHSYRFAPVVASLALLLVIAGVALLIAEFTAPEAGVVAVGGPQSTLVVPPGRSTEVLLTVNGDPIPAWGIAFFEANGIGRAEALDHAINSVLGLQIAQRLGLTATDEEAKEYLRDMQADWAKMSEEQWLAAEANLIAQGLTTENIEDDVRWLEYGIEVKTGIKLGQFFYRRSVVARLTGTDSESISSPGELAALEAGLDPQVLRGAMTELVIVTPGAPRESDAERFTRQERARAEIVPNPVGACTITEVTVICAGEP